MENKINLLYAEDDRDAAELTTCILEGEGFRVRHAPDGKHAWEAFMKQKPDILMVDLEMPKKNGIELIQLVREIDQSTPVVLFTSYATPGNEVSALEKGANDFIDKTCHPRVLVARLKSIYDRVCSHPSQPHVYVLSSRTMYNSVTRELKIDGNTIVLKPLDGQLLALLCAKCNQVAWQSYLISGLWGGASKSKESEVKKYISHLRASLSADPAIEIKSAGKGSYCLYTRELDR